MILCHCLVVSDGDLRASVDAGATTVGAVLAATGAGTRCGGCTVAVRACAKRLLDRADDDVTYLEVWHAAG
ncbi:MAG: (2Fe-2S)-binding protein [Candidatus Nanopelagicales bacterium]